MAKQHDSRSMPASSNGKRRLKLSSVKVVALPAELAACRPKALRFRLLHLAGRVVRHAGALVLRLAAAHPWAGLLPQIRRALVELAAARPPLPA